MSTEQKLPTQEQIDAALAMASLVPMTSQEVDAWFSAKDTVSAHARLGETNIETAARILAEAYKETVKSSETPGRKTLTFRTFQTPDGRPTCGSCHFLGDSFSGDGMSCFYDTPEDLFFDESFSLKPCDRCPLHNGKDDHAI